MRHCFDGYCSTVHAFRDETYVYHVFMTYVCHAFRDETYVYHACIYETYVYHAFIHSRHMRITHSCTNIAHLCICLICIAHLHVYISSPTLYTFYIYVLCICNRCVAHLLFISTCCASKYMLRNAQYVALDLCTCKMWCVRIMRELNLARSYSLREALHLQIHT